MYISSRKWNFSVVQFITDILYLESMKLKIITTLFLFLEKLI